MFAAVGTLLATVCGTVGLVLATLLVSPLVIVASGLRFAAAADSLIRLWARLVVFSSGVRVDRPARDQWPQLTPCILMSNHASLYDIPVLLLAVPWRIRFLAKRQLFNIPVLGWALHAAGFVPVDRGRGRSGARAFGAARKALERGVSLVIFPEETRSSDGRLLPFRAGGALLAMATGVPVVPLAIRGSLGVRRRDSWIIRPGTISVHYGDSLLPGEFEDRKQLNDAIRQQIARLAGQTQAKEAHEPRID